MNDEKSELQGGTATVDVYISGFPESVRNILTKIRGIIAEIAPEAQETISYGIPTFKLNGINLIHFAAFKKHIGVYPTPSGVQQFKSELTRFKSARGSVQFPLDQPVPFDLIRRIARYRVDQVKQHPKK